MDSFIKMMPTIFFAGWMSLVWAKLQGSTNSCFLRSVSFFSFFVFVFLICKRYTFVCLFVCLFVVWVVMIVARTQLLWSGVTLVTLCERDVWKSSHAPALELIILLHWYLQHCTFLLLIGTLLNKSVQLHYPRPLNIYKWMTLTGLLIRWISALMEESWPPQWRWQDMLSWKSTQQRSVFLQRLLQRKPF